MQNVRYNARRLFPLIVIMGSLSSCHNPTLIRPKKPETPTLVTIPSATSTTAVASSTTSRSSIPVKGKDIPEYIPGTTKYNEKGDVTAGTLAKPAKIFEVLLPAKTEIFEMGVDEYDTPYILIKHLPKDTIFETIVGRIKLKKGKMVEMSLGHLRKSGIMPAEFLRAELAEPTRIFGALYPAETRLHCQRRFGRPSNRMMMYATPLTNVDYDGQHGKIEFLAGDGLVSVITGRGVGEIREGTLAKPFRSFVAGTRLSFDSSGIKLSKPKPSSFPFHP